MISEAEPPAAGRRIDVATFVVEPFEDLFTHDVAFDVQLVEQRFAQDFAEGAERGLEALRWQRNAQGSYIFGSARLERAPQSFEARGELVSAGVSRCPAEQHVLEK